MKKEEKRNTEIHTGREVSDAYWVVGKARKERVRVVDHNVSTTKARTKHVTHDQTYRSIIFIIFCEVAKSVTYI